MALSKIPSAGFQDNVKFRNIIINGDMSIAQRGTSFTGLSNGDSQYTLDRFKFQEAGAPTYQFTLSQDTDVPTGQGFAKSLKMDCTTAQSSLAAADGLRIEQRFEGQNLQYLKKGTSSAESLTLSFWVKSNKTGTYIAEIFDNDNSRQISKAYTINSASTWEKKTLTYAGDTSGSLDNDNSHSLDVRIWLGAGSNFTSGTLNTSWNSVTAATRIVGQVNLADSTSNEWYITGVQLEAGTTASDFEFLPHDVNLQRCQRYYFKWGVTQDNTSGSVYSFGTGGNTNDVAFLLISPQIMRTFPSFTSSSLAVQDSVTQTNVTGLDSRESLSSSDRHFYVIHQTGSGSITQYRPYFATTSASSGYLAGDSEL